MSPPRAKALILTALLVVIVAIAAALAWARWPSPQGYAPSVMAHARELHEHIIAFDSRITVPLDFGTQGAEADRDGPGQFDLVKAGRGRLSGAALAIFGWPELWNGPNAPHHPTPGFVEEAREQQESRYRILTGMVRDFPEQVGFAYSPEDFRRLAMEGKFAIVMSLLNAYPLGDDLSALDRWHARGMRMFGFNYVGNNAWADSSRPLPFFNDSPDALGGLSPLGRQAVARLNDLGVVIDVSQMSTQALEQVAQLTRAPIVASHSAPRALVDIKRNLSDHELQLIANSGGVIQVVGFSGYLRPPSAATLGKLNALREQFALPPLAGLDNALMPGDPIIAIWPQARFGAYASQLYALLEEDPKATLGQYLDAIDYTVKKVGIDHVGISSDFNDGGGLQGWKDVSEARNLTAALIERGYSDADIAKLWGGNFLRAWQQVQAVARHD
ncbi:pyoverdine-tailoring dipeptidase-like protein PvdM [Pseudomonas sp. RIT-PI-S]|uniref:pyoverdine-tailoring dipeptidase-like protein PvdM n=1 Tax=Pseudomonas sp. RIT-PI-S TaxID=3035295 RepID=UPI0021DB08CA|nr:pyoverdine-tailoring dipeptidase-like protein PvdM [Pseudomonas sp. RIT-PI-S]